MSDAKTRCENEIEKPYSSPFMCSILGPRRMSVLCLRRNASSRRLIRRESIEKELERFMPSSDRPLLLLLKSSIDCDRKRPSSSSRFLLSTGSNSSSVSLLLLPPLSSSFTAALEGLKVTLLALLLLLDPDAAPISTSPIS